MLNHLQSIGDDVKRKITFLVFPHYELLDLSGPASAFNLANELFDAQYIIRVVSAEGGLVTDRAGMSIATETFVDVEEGETIIAVGGPTAHLHEINHSTITILAKAACRTKRIASVCTGTFLLAAAGLLDKRWVTTHWRYAKMLQTQYPSIRVDANRIHTRDGNIWTSAGMTAGIDLALVLIEDDFDFQVAKNVARDLVVYHRRPGGQSQYSAMLEMEPESRRIKDVLYYIKKHLNEPLSIDRLAEIACLSPRQFSRIFFNTTGNTPGKAIELLRLETAKPRVEDEGESLQKIAQDVGFGSIERMRRSFLNNFGHTPQEIRQTARIQNHLRQEPI